MFTYLSKHILTKHTRRILSLLLLLLPIGCLAPAQPNPTHLRDDGAPALALVGHLGGPALSVAAAGQYAYVGHSFEFAVVDVSDPTVPQRVGYLVLSSNDIAVADSHAYVASRSGLAVVDIRNPAHPVQVGAWPLTQPATSIAVDGDHAYLLAKGGLSIVDITHPAAPHLVGFVALPGRLEGVYTAGDTVYVSSNRGVHVIHAGNPQSPVERAFVTSPGYPEAAAVAGRMLLVAAGDQGLQAFAAESTPSAGMMLASADPRAPGPHGYAEAVAVQGDYAYVANGPEGLLVTDIRDPAQPVQVGALALPGYTLDVAVAGGYAFVVDRYHGMAIVDIAQPRAPAGVGLYAAPGFVGNVQVAGDRLFLTTVPQGDVHILDAVDPGHLYQTGFAATLDAAEAVAVDGQFAYVAGGYGGLEVLDLSREGRPVHTGWLPSPGYARDIQLVNSYAYVVADGGIQIVDIRAPLDLREGSCICGLGEVVDATVVGDTAAILTGDGRLHVVDVSAPEHPVPLVSIGVPGQPSAIAYGGDEIVVATNAGLHVLTFTGTGLTLLASYASLNTVSDVVLAGRYAYLAALEHGVYVLDLSDPTQPLEIAHFDTTDRARRIAVRGDQLFVADLTGGLFVLHLQEGKGR